MQPSRFDLRTLRMIFNLTIFLNSIVSLTGLSVIFATSSSTVITSAAFPFATFSAIPTLYNCALICVIMDAKGMVSRYVVHTAPCSLLRASVVRYGSRRRDWRRRVCGNGRGMM